MDFLFAVTQSKGRYNATRAQARENNASINTTEQGKGDMYVCAKPKLQDRKVVAHAQINTGPAGDTTRRERDAKANASA